MKQKKNKLIIHSIYATMSLEQEHGEEKEEDRKFDQN